MGKFDYIYKTKFRKMGKWNLLPLDSMGNWHSRETSEYFRKIFGFGKGTFIIQTLDDDTQHAYFPQFYIDKIYDYITRTNSEDYKKFERVIRTFYQLKKKTIKQIPKIKHSGLKKLSNKQLLNVFLQNRDWAHRVAPYDQFGWIAEDYWNPVMEKILENHGLKKGTDEFLKTLFILTKPEEISTTLIEKREILKQVIKLIQKQTNLLVASEKLAKQFGWMPVFVFGTPWDAGHYEKELLEISRKDQRYRQDEYQKLCDYKKIRNRDIRAAERKYKFSPRELQKFIDFGLCLDARNEAEYLISLCGFYVLPIYNEIAHRLYISVKQLRNLTKLEMVECLLGKKKAQTLLEQKGDIIGWVFDREMKELKNLDNKEARKFFNYLNKTSTNLQGSVENSGLCASPGLARGTAKITHTSSENNKVKNGDILITHATTVDYLPAMKRAAAFVTEVGGLTCHAAVVAREFGVPCVVGLKNATENFHDGDLVEVDANQGIVKIIKHG